MLLDCIIFLLLSLIVLKAEGNDQPLERIAEDGHIVVCCSLAHSVSQSINNHLLRLYHEPSINCDRDIKY